MGFYVIFKDSNLTLRYCILSGLSVESSVLSTTPNILQIRQNLKVISKRIPYSFVWRTNFLFISHSIFLSYQLVETMRIELTTQTLQKSIAMPGTCAPIGGIFEYAWKIPINLAYFRAVPTGFEPVPPT